MIEQGIAVSLAYSLTDNKGTVLDQADAQKPFWYLHGAGHIIPGLEQALTGLKTGDKKNVTVAPENGYGLVDDNLRFAVNRSQLGEVKDLEVGMRFIAETPDGEQTVFSVLGVEGDTVKLDGNHPLAGIELTFEVEVLDTRKATKEELEHGHVHGPDAHDH